MAQSVDPKSKPQYYKTQSINKVRVCPHTVSWRVRQANKITTYEIGARSKTKQKDMGWDLMGDVT
jgi:hypothetical protein